MQTRRMFSLTGLAGLVLVTGIVSAMVAWQEAPKPRATPPRPASPPTMGKSLFDRVGGTYAIAAVVDDYINNLVKDPVVMANPQVKAAVEKAAANNGVPGLKYQITAFVIQATGGPYKYNGGAMQPVHAKLQITQSEWDASAAVFKATLDRFKVPAAEQAELFALVETTHDDIVVDANHDHDHDHPHRN